VAGARGALRLSIASFDTEHEQMAADLAVTRKTMATFRRTATRADVQVAAAAMVSARYQFGIIEPWP
jgi:hypothetical protein